MDSSKSFISCERASRVRSLGNSLINFLGITSLLTLFALVGIVGWLVLTSIPGCIGDAASRVNLVTKKQELGEEQARLRTEFLAISGVPEAQLEMIRKLDAEKWPEALKSLGTSEAKKFALVLEVAQPLDQFKATGDREWLDSANRKLEKFSQAERDDVMDRATRFLRALDQSEVYKFRDAQLHHKANKLRLKAD